MPQRTVWYTALSSWWINPCSLPRVLSTGGCRAFGGGGEGTKEKPGREVHFLPDGHHHGVLHRVHLEGDRQVLSGGRGVLRVRA